MKTYFLLLCLLLSTGFVFSQPSVETREIKIMPGSSLSISGNTNINDFECDFDTLCFQDQTITVNFSSKGEVLDFRNSVLPLKNNNFNCGNKRINRDVKDLLKTDEHPEILLKIKKIDLKKDKAQATLNFTIAGIDKDYTFPVEVTGDETMCFNGKLALNITDFNLKAPSKVFGLIVIDEVININFNLNVQSLEDKS